jgi:hypothetical protein
MPTRSLIDLPSYDATWQREDIVIEDSEIGKYGPFLVAFALFVAIIGCLFLVDWSMP